MNNEITYRQFIENYEAGMYNSSSREIQCDAGWYDWFCADSTLSSRLNAMYPIVKAISKSPKIDIDKTYVFFKNNCPMWVDNTYDDFRICNIEGEGDVLYTVVPSYPEDKSTWISCVWGVENNFNGEIVRGSLKNVLDFFEVSMEEKYEQFIDPYENEDEICDCGYTYDDCHCFEEDEEFEEDE